LVNVQNGQQGIGMPTGSMPHGDITCGGQTCGTADFFEPGLHDETGDILAGIAIGGAVDFAVGRAIGWVGGLLGRGAAEAASTAASTGGKTFSEIFDAATPAASTSRVATREMAGGMAQAQKDFDSLAGTAVKAGRVEIKDLPNGEGRAVLRSFSSESTGNRPTLELQPASGGSKGQAIRYNP
jgi:hypothetical protein